MFERSLALPEPGPYGQTLFSLRRIEVALREVGASLADVVRARYLVTDIEHADAIGRAHAEMLRVVRPAMTMAQVGALMLPEHLVEVEVDAVAAPVHGGPWTRSGAC